MDQWVQSFPVVTRTYMAGALLTTAACALDVLSPFSLYLSWSMVRSASLPATYTAPPLDLTHYGTVERNPGTSFLHQLLLTPVV
jgi:hypothetical protein